MVRAAGSDTGGSDAGEAADAGKPDSEAVAIPPAEASDANDLCIKLRRFVFIDFAAFD